MNVTAQIHSQKQKDRTEEKACITKAPPGLYPWHNEHWLILETTDAGQTMRIYLYIYGGGKVLVYNNPKYEVDLNKRISSGSITLTYG